MKERQLIPSCFVVFVTVFFQEILLNFFFQPYKGTIVSIGCSIGAIASIVYACKFGIFMTSFDNYIHISHPVILMLNGIKQTKYLSHEVLLS